MFPNLDEIDLKTFDRYRYSIDIRDSLAPRRDLVNRGLSRYVRGRTPLHSYVMRHRNSFPNNTEHVV